MTKRRKKAAKKARKKPTTYRVSRAALVKVIHLGAAHHSALAALKKTVRVGQAKKTRRKTAKKRGKRPAKR